MAKGPTKKRYKLEERQAHVEAFRAGGDSQQGYADNAGISVASLQKWSKEFPQKRARASHVEDSARAGYSKRPDAGTIPVPREMVKQMIQTLTGLL